MADDTITVGGVKYPIIKGGIRLPNDYSLPTTTTVTQNPDIKVSVATNPITPPNVIVAKQANEAQATAEVAKTEAVKPVKPEFVVDVSKYFKTTYLDLEEEFKMVTDTRRLLYPNITKADLYLMPPASMVLGKGLVEKGPLGNDSHKIILKFTKENQNKIDEILKWKAENGAFPEGGSGPKWLTDKTELLAKKYYYYYASHRKLEDYGMDMDYLTMPVIDREVRSGLLEIDSGIVEMLGCLVKYEDLLKEYSGVSTVGKLGRELKIDGVELYSLWKELDRVGLITDYNWKQKGNKGIVTDKTSNKWLEVASNVSVKELVNSLNVSPNYKDKLVNYLISIQNGKKRDESFIQKYDNLKISYRDDVVEGSTMRMVARSLFIDTLSSMSEQYFYSDFSSRTKGWMPEYTEFEELFNARFHTLNRVSRPEFASRSKAGIDEMISETTEKFKGKIPLGQEFLFSFLENMDNLPQEDLDRGIYKIKYK